MLLGKDPLSIQVLLLDGFVFLGLSTIVLACIMVAKRPEKLHFETTLAALPAAIAISSITLLVLFLAVSPQTIRDPVLLLLFAPHLLVGTIILPLRWTIRLGAWFEFLLCATAIFLAVCQEIWGGPPFFVT
jgi:hypothetical protein